MDLKFLKSVQSSLSPYEPEDKETKDHIRGSTLLLAGRVFAVGINLGTQVLLVRHLSKAGYGAFAYALAIVSLGSTVAVFGLEKSVGRFIAIYQEQGDHGKVVGTIVLMFGTILSLGLTICLLVFGLNNWLNHRLIHDQEAMAMVLILIALSPIQALEAFFTGLFSVFARPRAIFFRKHLLGPCLYFLVVLLLSVSGSSAKVIAGGYLVAGVIGVGVSGATLMRILRHNGIFKAPNQLKIDLPWREVFGFTAPLLVTDLVFVLRTQFVVVLLEYFKSTTDVADYRAVLPIARFNLVVYQNFAILFMPLAARMFARNDRTGMNNLYQKTAIWIAVISFPLFAVSSSLSKPLITLLFSERYEGTATVLALLSFGFYFSAALGFNGQTLRIFGKVRYIFITDLMTAIISVVLSLVLIPRYGAIGAAISLCSTLIMQNVLYQIGLMFLTGVGFFSPEQIKVYLIIVLCWVGLFLLPPLSISLIVAAIVSLLVFRLNRRSLDIERTFPELFSIPLMRRIFGS